MKGFGAEHDINLGVISEWAKFINLSVHQPLSTFALSFDSYDIPIYFLKGSNCNSAQIIERHFPNGQQKQIDHILP